MSPPLIHVDNVRGALSVHRPQLVSGPEMPFASVAMILTGGRSDPEVLFIERARREGDRWSGQMAFPGGRVEESDRDLRDTAERETSEEVGIDLGSAELLGRLDDQGGRRFGDSTAFFIAAYVYYLAKAPALELSQEVEEALWVPAVTLTDPASRVQYELEDAVESFPGILVGRPDRHIVWGLTYRMVGTFLDVVGAPLVDRHDERFYDL